MVGQLPNHCPKYDETKKEKKRLHERVMHVIHFILFSREDVSQINLSTTVKFEAYIQSTLNRHV